MKNRRKNGLDIMAENLSEAPEFEVFFDGKCPLCSREIAVLRLLDRKKRIRFSDISTPDFDAARLGKTYDDMMAEIHGRLPDGSWVVGVEVFRRLYAAIGLRSLVAISRWPVISQALDAGYRVFAPLRLKLRPACKADGSCRIPAAQAKGQSSISPDVGAVLKAGARRP